MPVPIVTLLAAESVHNAKGRDTISQAVLAVHAMLQGIVIRAEGLARLILILTASFLTGSLDFSAVSEARFNSHFSLSRAGLTVAPMLAWNFKISKQ